jgi:hypothetical protein
MLVFLPLTIRRTRAEVQKLVEEFRHSGIRRIDFCRENGFALSTLARHLRKSKKQRHGYKSRTIATNTLVPVQIAEDQCSLRISESGVAVVLSGGRRVQVKVDFDVPTLHRLLNALERA